MAISQRADDSPFNVPQNTLATMVPIVPKLDAGKDSAEYSASSLMLALTRNRIFKILERNHLQNILDELSFHLSELADENKAEEMGKFLGVKKIRHSNMYPGETNYELILKLLMLETGEVLSMTRTSPAKALGLDN